MVLWLKVYVVMKGIFHLDFAYIYFEVCAEFVVKQHWSVKNIDNKAKTDLLRTKIHLNVN